jgi:NAD(P)-dependent dehydrogenase (short-subunit alcohol dehydrogenase family)
MTLSEKSAVVTGGTGVLGRAVVAALLAEGTRVAVPFRRPGDLDLLRKSIGIGPDEPLSGALLDLTDEPSVIDWFETVAEDRGGLDILVNTAGGFSGGSPVHETPWSVWQQQMDLNLKTAVLASRAAAPHLIRRGGGAIVNVSSRPATLDGKNLGAYAASKRAVLALTEAMAAELLESRVTVNAILPSTIDTEENRKAMPKADYTKWPKAEEIARVILFLVGPDARLISGARVPVYGRA